MRRRRRRAACADQHDIRDSVTVSVEEHRRSRLKAARPAGPGRLALHLAQCRRSPVSGEAPGDQVLPTAVDEGATPPVDRCGEDPVAADGEAGVRARADLKRPGEADEPRAGRRGLVPSEILHRDVDERESAEIPIDDDVRERAPGGFEARDHVEQAVAVEVGERQGDDARPAGQMTRERQSRRLREVPAAVPDSQRYRTRHDVAEGATARNQVDDPVAVQISRVGMIDALAVDRGAANSRRSAHAPGSLLEARP